MDKRELEMYKIEDIIKDLLKGTAIREIARVRKVSKNTVKSYRTKLETIKSKYPNEGNLSLERIMEEISLERKKEKHSQNFGWLSNNKERVQSLQSKCNNILILHENLKNSGFMGSYSSLIRFITKNNADKDKPVIRIETKAGEVAQVDFGYVGKIFDSSTGNYIKAYVFVMVLGFSRDAYYEIVKNQNVETWCSCHSRAFEHFGGVPKIIIPDNLKSGIIKASFLDPVANKSYADLAKHYGFQINPCIPNTPEHKGKVESGVKYVKNNFLPLRDFEDFNDANRQLQNWNETKARVRIHGTTREKPKDLFEKYEKQELIQLNRERFEIPVWKELKAGRDIHIQFDKRYYSVPCEYRGKYVWGRKIDSQVTIFYENKLIAAHLTGLYPGQRITNKDHYPANEYSFMQYDSEYCLEESKKIGENVASFVNKILNEEPIHNLRTAQNIIRLGKKYELDKLDKACSKAIHYGNYTYKCVKNILENNLFEEKNLFTEENKSNLSGTFARNLKEILVGDNNYGN